MASPSPLEDRHRRARAEFIAVSASPDGGGEPREVRLVSTFGEPQAEYAAIRKAAGLLDSPHRACLMVTGTDRIDFLERLLTNGLRDLAPGRSRRAFWTNRQGRIQADLTVIALPDALMLDLDLFRVNALQAGLDALLFSEDVAIEDQSHRLHRLSLFGPACADLLAGVFPGSADLLLQFAPEDAIVIDSEGPVVAWRNDSTGEPGFDLAFPADRADALWDDLLEAGLPRGLRTIGWHAWNVARIEAGTPIYLVDFGPDSLPAETGLLEVAVSFRKGCYPGQEVITRMHNLGKPARRLVGLKIRGGALPDSGAAVMSGTDESAVVGAVTSAAPSPMLGNTPVAFAMMRYSSSEPGTEVSVEAEGQRVPAVVGPLRFLPQGR